VYPSQNVLRRAFELQIPVAVGTDTHHVKYYGNNFRESIQAVGSDVLYVSRMPWIITGDYFRYRNRPHISYEETEELALRMRDTKAINPSTFATRNVKYRSTVLENILIIGTTDKEMLVSASVPEFGRYFSAADVHNRRFVCVIGSEIREHLFKNADPLNKDIKLGRYTFRVIGVMESQGSGGFFGGPNFDRQISIPITSFIKAYGIRNREIEDPFDALTRWRHKRRQLVLVTGGLTAKTFGNVEVVGADRGHHHPAHPRVARAGDDLFAVVVELGRVEVAVRVDQHCATSSPSRIASTLPACAASSVSCVTITKLMPSARFRSSISPNIWRAVARSRLPVGSSARTQRGRVTSALASATRWRSPPESCPGRWSVRAARPTRPSMSRAASAACLTGVRRMRSGIATFSSALNSGSR